MHVCGVARVLFRIMQRGVAKTLPQNTPIILDTSCGEDPLLGNVHFGVHAPQLSLTRVTKSYLLALGTTQISSFHQALARQLLFQRFLFLIFCRYSEEPLSSSVYISRTRRQRRTHFLQIRSC